MKMTSTDYFSIFIILVGSVHAYVRVTENVEDFLHETLDTDPPIDCLVTQWSEWSVPFFGDTATRTRDVLRYPVNNGIQCPGLIEYKHTGVPVTVNQTAEALTSNFLLGGYQTEQALMRVRRQAGIGYLRDLVVIIDASGSIRSYNFEVAKNQLAEMVGLLCPTNPFRSTMNRLAVLRYASYVTEMFDFNDYSSTWAVQNAIRSISYTGGATQTGDAFIAAEAMFTSAKGARPDAMYVKPEVLILTDGRSSNPAAAINAALSLREVAEVYALVIGTFTDSGKDEILQYVSNPIENHLFSVKNFDELVELVTYAKELATNRTCASFVPY